MEAAGPELRDGLRAGMQEMTAEAEQKLAALEPPERESTLKRGWRPRAVSSRRCGRGSSGSGLKSGGQGITAGQRRTQ